MGLGLLFHILLGFREVEGLGVDGSALRFCLIILGFRVKG